MSSRTLLYCIDKKCNHTRKIHSIIGCIEERCKCEVRYSQHKLFAPKLMPRS